MTNESGDVAFNHAARLAAKAFRETDLQRAAKGAAAALISYLRSDKPLTRPDREMLADMLSGELCRPPHRRGKTWQERRDDDTLAMDIRARRGQLVALGMVASVAERDAAEEYQRDPRARNRSATTLARLAAHDPYVTLLGEARDWQRQEIASGLAEDAAALRAAGWASLDPRAQGKTADAIRRDLLK